MTYNDIHTYKANAFKLQSRYRFVLIMLELQLEDVVHHKEN